MSLALADGRCLSTVLSSLEAPSTSLLVLGPRFPSSSGSTRLQRLRMESFECTSTENWHSRTRTSRSGEPRFFSSFHRPWAHHTLSCSTFLLRASEKIFEGGLWFSSFVASRLPFVPFDHPQTHTLLLTVLVHRFFGGGNSTWASPKDQVGECFFLVRSPSMS